MGLFSRKKKTPEGDTGRSEQPVASPAPAPKEEGVLSQHDLDRMAALRRHMAASSPEPEPAPPATVSALSLIHI